MVDQKAVGNLALGTALEVDNLEARTEAGVVEDPEEHIEFGVDLEECTVLEVGNPEVCTVLGVAPQNNIDPQFVLGKSYLEVEPRVVIDYLGVSPQAVTDHPEVAPQAVTEFPEVDPQKETDCLEFED